MKRTVSGWVWCLGTLCLCGASGAQAQACPDAEEPQARRLAERYAPILSFGPGERYFPTIPFFTAYDNRDAPFDFGDSARVARHVVAGRLRWDSLDAAYHRRLTADFRRIQVYAPAYAAVFYRVRCLVGKQNKQFWGFIRNDNQAFHRSGLDTLYAQGLRDAQFAVIEYFLYYLRDAGLEGHQHDIERVVVFTPQRVARDAPVRVQQNLPAMNEAEAQSLVQSLLVVVGTGHSSTTPNNVLVLLNEQASRLENPTILVELGGHSSAPDLNRDNAFQVGLDVNWNLRGSVWGTRDAQSVAGLGFIGHYEDWMTLPRSACISATLAPGSTADRSREFIQAKVDSAQQMPCGALQGPAVPEVPAVRYALLPVGPFERLARQVSAIARARSSADTTAVLDTVRSVVNGELRPALDPLWGFPGFPDASDAKVLTALGGMGYWRTVEHAGGTRIWDHPDYRKSPIRCSSGACSARRSGASRTSAMSPPSSTARWGSPPETAVSSWRWG